MLNIKVKETPDGKGFEVDLQAEGSAHTIAQELHTVIQNITERVPKVAEILCELAEADFDED